MGLAVHETAEEEIVHPAARSTLTGGGVGLVDDRLDEENAAKRQLSQLEEIGPEGPGFLEALDKLRLAVLTHARNEERRQRLEHREQPHHA